MGSDAVFTGFGENAREFEAFVEAEIGPEAALRAATAAGAALLGHEDELGAVAPGYWRTSSPSTAVRWPTSRP